MCRQQAVATSFGGAGTCLSRVARSTFADFAQTCVCTSGVEFVKSVSEIKLWIERAVDVSGPWIAMVPHLLELQGIVGGEGSAPAAVSILIINDSE